MPNRTRPNKRTAPEGRWDNNPHVELDFGPGGYDTGQGDAVFDELYSAYEADPRHPSKIVWRRAKPKPPSARGLVLAVVWTLVLGVAIVGALIL